jgi:site-specific DNA-methyltransferase (adenine-specific)
MAESKVYLMDCMELMAKYPDKHFDLAIVDPPYGANDAIDISNGNSHAANRKEYKQFKNLAPCDLYFKEVYRVSKKHIIWGGNFFGLSGGVIVWNKNGTAFGEAEIAVCNTHKSVRIFEYTWNGMLQQDMKDKESRIHPTQKPIQLYKWLLTNYAKSGDKILDTHLGSGSSRIAAEILDFDFTGCEIDKDYFDAQEKRFKLHLSQPRLAFEAA